ncbi:MAG TPA: YaiO family outer membrane beta-barrel protein, partial [Cytophagaceae bacterium]|nr:YaiO family outer membrane beta-barrel protein [Cytophagaceae bacterium]
MRLLFLSFLFVCGLHAIGQVHNPDSAFTVAREIAYAGKYETSEKMCKELISQYPTNSEYKIFLARIYSWQKQFEQSKEILKTVATAEPANEDALDALTDAELWSGNYEQVIVRCNEGLKLHPASESFMLKKTKALMLSDKLNEAQATVDELLKLNPNHQDAQKLRAEIMDKRMKNKISASYLNIAFNNPGASPWHFAYLEYKRDLKKFPILARVNYGKVYDDDAVQVEVDAYPKLGKKTYMYLNTGYSPGPNVFPLFKAGAEIYQGLPKAFEISLGGRYMQFNTENVFIYTGYLGKYHKDWWFAYRP